MAQVKHLAAYNGADSVLVDERTLHEIYLPAFEAAVKAGVASAMCAYNQVNGVFSCENSEILNDVLRERWGFRGFVTSDWGATHTPTAILVGLEMARASPAGAVRTYGRIEGGCRVGYPGAAIDQAAGESRSDGPFGLLKANLRGDWIDGQADARLPVRRRRAPCR
jgi:beta-glucosidase